MRLTRQQKEALQLMKQEGGTTQRMLVDQDIYRSQSVASQALEILKDRNWVKEKEAPSNEHSRKVYILTQDVKEIYAYLIENPDKSENNGSI